jgi:hypothetical protein
MPTWLTISPVYKLYQTPVKTTLWVWCLCRCLVQGFLLLNPTRGILSLFEQENKCKNNYQQDFKLRHHSLGRTRPSSASVQCAEECACPWRNSLTRSIVVRIDRGRHQAKTILKNVGMLPTFQRITKLNLSAPRGHRIDRTTVHLHVSLQTSKIITFNKSLKSHWITEIKVLISFFACWWKDPDPGGTKT